MTPEVRNKRSSVSICTFVPLRSSVRVLYFCIRKASVCRSILYFCTSKASKLSSVCKTLEKMLDLFNLLLLTYADV
jgi:hypothetical protein